jgi:GWxTD domain-containing protein
MPRRIVLVLLLLILGGRRAAAQAPAERVALEALRDSLQQTSDSVGLLLLEKKLIAEAKEHRDDPMVHLRLGFLALRLGELAASSHFDDAASEFQWAIDVKPDWPYPWFGMGLAELALGDSKVSVVAGLKTMFGKDALARSAAAFARSAEVDPSFVTGLVELANTALRQRVNIRLAVALEALRRAATTPAGAHPDVLLARGRVERAAGNADSALAAMRAYDVAVKSAPLARFELGRTRLWHADAAGRDDYFAGAEGDDAGLVALYRADLQPVASESDMGEFDAQRGTYRRQWLQRFWGERDARDLRSPGERLVEHYRRVFYARQQFQLVGRWTRQFDISETYRSGSREFDDRGIIYIRHGEPTNRAFYNVGSLSANEGIPPNESWSYARPDGDMIFHFVAREDVQDFRLVESLLDILGYSRTVRLQGADALSVDPVAEQLVISREQFAPVYQRMLQQGRMGLGRAIADERLLVRENLRRGTSTDGHELAFARKLDATCQVLGVGADGTAPLVHVTCGVPGRALRPVQIPEGHVYTLRLRFVATDAVGRVVASVDTTRRFLAAQPIPPDEYQVGLLTLRAATTGPLAYRLALARDDSTGVVFEREQLAVPPVAPSNLAISDLVLGRRGANVRWQATEVDTVFMNPVGTFRRNETLELYYELLAAAAGEQHNTELTVRKGAGRGLDYQLGRSGAGGSRLSIKFSEVAPPGRWRVQRSVSLDRLKPGDYTLEVTVNAGSGSRVVRRRAFRIVE